MGLLVVPYRATQNLHGQEVGGVVGEDLRYRAKTPFALEMPAHLLEIA